MNDVRPNSRRLKLLFIHLNESQEEIQSYFLCSIIILKDATRPMVDHFRRKKFRKNPEINRSSFHFHLIRNLFLRENIIDEFINRNSIGN